MNIDELYEHVTEAILHAERLEDQGPSAEELAAPRGASSTASKGRKRNAVFMG